MYPSSTRSMKDSGMEKIKTEDGFEGWSTLGCDNDYEGYYFLTCLAKTVIKHDVLEQHSSSLKEMTSGHYVSI